MNTMTSEASHLTERAAGVARQGARWARDGGEYVLLHASRATGRARGYVREHPMQTMLVAAAAGALIFALAHLLSSRSDR